MRQILKPLEGRIQHRSLHSVSHTLTVLTLNVELLFQRKLVFPEQKKDDPAADLFNAGKLSAEGPNRKIVRYG